MGVVVAVAWQERGGGVFEGERVDTPVHTMMELRSQTACYRGKLLLTKKRSKKGP